MAERVIVRRVEGSRVVRITKPDGTIVDRPITKSKLPALESAAKAAEETNEVELQATKMLEAAKEAELKAANEAELKATKMLEAAKESEAPENAANTATGNFKEEEANKKAIAAISEKWENYVMTSNQTDTNEANFNKLKTLYNDQILLRISVYRDYYGSFSLIPDTEIEKIFKFFEEKYPDPKNKFLIQKKTFFIYMSIIKETAYNIAIEREYRSGMHERLVEDERYKDKMKKLPEIKLLLNNLLEFVTGGRKAHRKKTKKEKSKKGGKKNKKSRKIKKRGGKQ